MAGFHVENFGCRAARADGEAVSARLRADGLSEQPLAQADVVVLNTCSVTAEADRDARAFLRRTRRLNPAARVVVTGCYAQRAPEELAALAGVSAVVGNSHKGLLPEIVRELALNTPTPTAPPQYITPAQLTGPVPVWANDGFAHSAIEEAQVLPGAQTRPNLKIQEGCSNRCTFCIIPTTRGNSRSLPTEKVLAQVHGFLAAGGHELVFSGINLGRWGRDLPPANGIQPTLASLVRDILTQTTLPRLRLSSIEPMDWTPDLIQLLADFAPSARLARHVHLPLQSGSDAVLRRMHRRYRPWHYAAKVAQLSAAAGPGLALGADVMVGFPGETDAEFAETHAFIQQLPFTYLHLFPFSPRPGTPGWQLHQASPVPAAVVRRRMHALESLAAQKSHAFRATFLGRTLPAITLNTRPAHAAEGLGSALTDNFLPVELTHPAPANQLIRVAITAITPTGVLQGSSIETPPLPLALPQD